jgi:hypothetical protein
VGAGVDDLKKQVEKLTKGEVYLNIQEVRKAELDATLVAENVAAQLERRVAFRRALKKAMQTGMKFGAKGFRICAAGSSWWRGDGTLRVVPRWPRAPAHASRGHRLRDRDGEDYLRHYRYQVLDLQG